MKGFSAISNYLCLVLLGTLLLFQHSFGQTKKELQRKNKKLQEEIKLSNRLLQETKKDKALSLDVLLKLNSKIDSRSGLIANINAQLGLIAKEIKTNEHIIVSLEQDLSRLKEEYAKMIYYAFKHKTNYDKMMFVLASESFNQAYKRLKYIQQYAAYRKSQVAEIITTRDALKTQIEQLRLAKQEQSGLIVVQQKEQQKLLTEKEQREKTVQQLKSKEQELKNKIKAKQQKARKLQKAIQRIIEEEIRKAREAAKKSGSKEQGFPLTPEALKLSNSFSANKGKLPWPVLEGVITERFGKHPHPVLQGIVVNNNGIDISTTKGATARAIFDGEVSSVVVIPGEGKVVMVRHGEYLSVYSYLNNVFVQKGDKVITKQRLGTLISDTGKDKTALHLEIWKGMTKLNPEYWIYRK